MTDLLSGPPGKTDYNTHPHIEMGQIVSIMRQRRSQDSIPIREMIEIRDRYNGDVVLPVPDVQGSPTLDIPTPRLIAMAVDGNAMRAASSSPAIECPWTNAGSSRSRKNADLRRRVLYAKWSASQMDIKTYRWYRHLCAYGTAALVALPDNETKSARIELRDPLTAYPELRDPGDIRNPKNVGFLYGRSVDWITTHFPESSDFFWGAANKEWDTLWDVIEWIDEWEIVIGIMGPRMPAYAPQDARPYGYGGFELCRYENRAGCVPVVMPRRVTLDRVKGQMSTMVDTVDLHARMTALQVLSAEKHVFPDIAMLSEPNEVARLASGNWKDGRTGEVNVVQGARGVQYLIPQEPAFVPATIQQLEDTIRQSGGASDLYSGENPNSLRTGRALQQMGSFSIDPGVQEMQRVAEKAFSCILKDSLEVEKAYYPSAKHVFFTGLLGSDAVVEYSPSDLDSTEVAVKYPLPGADISQMSVAVAQLSGAELISKHTARVLHPMIADATQEDEMVNLEKVTAAVFAAFAQQTAQGQVPLPDAVRVLELLQKQTDIVDAINTAQKEAQSRQATPAQPDQNAQPGAQPPGAQPGLAQPGMGMEQPPIPEAPMGLQNLHGLTRALTSAPPPPALNGPANNA